MSSVSQPHTGVVSTGDGAPRSPMPGNASPLPDDVVAITVLDNAGIHRMKGVVGRKWSSAVVDGVGMSPSVALFTGSGGIALRDGQHNALGDLRLRPDTDALHKLPSTHGWWWVPADMTQQDGTVFAAIRPAGGSTLRRGRQSAR